MANLAQPSVWADWKNIYAQEIVEGYYDAIQEIQNQYIDLVNKRSAAYGRSNPDQTIRKELLDLKKVLLQQEQKLFGDLGYSSDPAKALKEMDQKLQELNNNEGFQLLCNGTPQFQNFVNSVAGTDTDYSGEVEAIFTSEESKRAFGEYLDLQTINNTPEMPNNVGAQIRAAINIALLHLDTANPSGSNAKGGLTSSRMPFDLVSVNGRPEKIYHPERATGLDYVVQQIRFTVKAGEDNHPVADNVYFKFKAPPNDEIKKKLKDVGITFSKPDLNVNGLDYVKQTLQQKLGPLYVYAQPYLEGDKQSQISIGLNKSNLAGFLGELRTVIFLQYMTNNNPNNTVTAAGMIRADREILGTVSAAKEIPIDAFLNDIGFQVKNYNISGSAQTYSPSQTLNLPRFVSRMTTDEEVRYIIIRFFVAESYNNYLLADGSEINGITDAYKQLYSGFSFNREQRFKTIADSYLQNLLQIESKFAILDETLPPELTQQGAAVMRYNTIFVIGRFIVPASSIIDAIIAELDNNGFSTDVKDTKSLIRTSYHVSNPQQRRDKFKAEAQKNKTDKPVKQHYLSKAEQEEKLIQTWDNNGNKVSVPVEPIAKTIDVDFRLSLSLQRILDRAYNKLQNRGISI